MLTSLKRNTADPNPALRSFHLCRLCLTSKLWGYIYRWISIGGGHTCSSTPPSKDSSIGEEKTKRHDSKAPFSLHLQEGWEGPSRSPPTVRTSFNQTEARKMHKKMMVAHPFWGVLRERSVLHEEKWFTDSSCNELLTLPHAHHKKKRLKSQDQSLLAQDRANQKSDRPIKLKQESYMSLLMAAPYQAINALW